MESMIRENACRNASKRRDYDPVSGLNCYGERFELYVPEKKPRKFYLPVEMRQVKGVRLITEHGSITGALRSLLKRKPSETDVDLFWLRLCEERYKYDFEFFAVACIEVLDKKLSQYVRFRLRVSQRRLLAVMETERRKGQRVHVQIVKAKQMGFSTFVQIYMCWIQTIHRENWHSVIWAHDMTAAANIRSMYEKAIKEMPAIGGVEYSISSFGGMKNIKVIPESGSRITVGSAENPDSSRSQNFKMAHLSELAFYPSTVTMSPEQTEASIVSSMTDGPDTLIVRESTANGVGDYFYDQYQKAKAGKSIFIPFFAPWFWLEIYEMPFDGSYYLHNGRLKKGTVAEFVSTLNDYELTLWRREKECTLENLNWYRFTKAGMPSDSLMRQEYPSDDMEAFRDSGSPVFNSDDVERLRPGCCLPVAVCDVVSACSPSQAVVNSQRRKDVLSNLRLVTDVHATECVLGDDVLLRFTRGMNKLWVWEYPDREQRVRNRYLVVLEPQKGTSEGADYGVIKVYDRYWMMTGGKPEVVALFYGHLDMDITMWMAAQVAKLYDDALLAVECNTYDTASKHDDESEFIFEVIAEYYDNLYSRTPADKIREGAPVKYGFHTNRSTKTMIVDNYKAVIREDGYIERDEVTLDEARTFEEKPNGKKEAKAGRHDDRIMNTMIALYVCYEEMPMPYVVREKINSHQAPMRTAW
ncbi:MAG: hypothetical protein LBH80_06965 [Prevotellaceae bacterium]|nr:hypothetical protein [Prevotellaceae bacterium]